MPASIRDHSERLGIKPVLGRDGNPIVMKPDADMQNADWTKRQENRSGLPPRTPNAPPGTDNDE